MLNVNKADSNGDVNGTGMDNPPNNEPSGAVSSRTATRRNPTQGRIRSGVNNSQNSMIRIDTNKHGIRRETPTNNTKKTGRKKV